MRNYESFKIEGDLEKAFYRGWTARVYSNTKNTNIFSFTISFSHFKVWVEVLKGKGRNIFIEKELPLVTFENNTIVEVWYDELEFYI